MIAEAKAMTRSPLPILAGGLAAVLVWTVPTRATVPSVDPARGVWTLAPVVEPATQGVVNISVLQRRVGQANPLFNDPFFRRFFNLPDRPPPRQALSAGSGVIVDAGKGFVLTNHHVVDNAEEVMVTLKDQRRLKGRLVGSDKETDIALLQIEPGDLKAVPFGDSDRLKVGDLVIAIGNPFGLGQTVTSGIVSALGRSGLGIEGYEDFIQTDASINPGNSGGALVNSKGELIGINTAIIGPSGGNVGIGFAVPSNMARAVMDQLVRYGEVRRGRLGIALQDLTPELAEALGLPSQGGAVVTQVEPGSPAQKAGLEPGDAIVAINGESIRNGADLRNRVGLVPRGDKVELAFHRKDRRLTAKVEVAEAEAKAVTGERATPRLAGATFADLGPEHPLHGKVKGALVAGVERGSPAARFGLRPGDVVVAVNRQPVRSAEEFVGAVKNAERVIALNLIRGDSQVFLMIQ
jgi:serine protease Do/serine protease DegQ